MRNFASSTVPLTAPRRDQSHLRPGPHEVVRRILEREEVGVVVQSQQTRDRDSRFNRRIACTTAMPRDNNCARF
jgi:hypothetical protein